MTSGIININKPAGIASFSVVAQVRRLTGVKRVGHAGTLDPIANGVLPICLGNATRVVDELVSAPKAYRAVIRLGSATDTFDSEGVVTATGDASGVTEAELRSALDDFVGEIQQLPPMYSALKHQGQPLYRYARAGQNIERQPRTVAIYSLTLLRFESPIVEIQMEVGRGAYVRTVAHDLGEKLGCHAHLEGLTRTRSGPFRVEEAISLEHFREAAQRGVWQNHLHPPDRVLESWQAALLGEAHSREATQGRLLVLEPLRVEIGELELNTPCRAYSTEGEFLAILRYRGAGRWHPAKVFS